MSKPTSNNDATSTPTTTIPDAWENIPCVQYGFPNNKGPKRAPKLRTIFDPVPDDAETASPVYLLSRDQYERQDNFEKGYEVADYKMIATELQDECEADDRVLCPIHIESDEYHQEGPATLIGWFREFVEDYLDVPFHTCTLYFSGRRSIHVHAPRLVSGEAQRERLKKLAQTFCTEKGAGLDCAIYGPKRMFRLPGVEHSKTGIQKVEIEPEWSRDRIFWEANETTPDVPESYEAVLRRVFATQPSLTVESSQTTLEPPYDLFRILDSEKTVLEFESDKRDIETPLIEQVDCPDDVGSIPKWTQYNAKEFSPYALANGNDRSVAVLKVKGAAFARKDVRNGAALVPAYFYGAQGCAGEEFTKSDEHAPLQLSAQDFEKWDYEVGDDVVIIGGQSRNSRVFRVTSWQATALGHALTGEDASRQAALDFLDKEGYDTGSAGSSTSSTATSDSAPTGTKHIWSAREHPQTEAEALQKQAEQKGIETLTHHERIKVACRHLRYGWKPTWDWFKDQFGSNFKSDVTWKFLSSIAEDPDFEEYDHIEVPNKPP